MNATESKQRIAELERELQRYQEIAAQYRHVLGDARANEILSPLHHAQRVRDEMRAKKPDACTPSTIMEWMRVLRPDPKPTP